MFNKIKSVFSISQKLQLAIIIFIYIIFVSVFGFAYRYDMYTDEVAYLRLAGYIAEGNFYQSVTGYWAPLITWCIAPFLTFGIDGLIIARIVIALWGLIFVIGIWLLTSKFNLSHSIKFIAVSIAALLIAYWIMEMITPDVLIAALLTYYLYIVTDPNILKQKKIAFLCGIFGGFAYLAKHYAFPFFLVHYPLILLLRACIVRDANRVPLKKIFVPLVIGMASFLVISSPYILLISSKYQRLTFGTTGSINHTVIGPKDISRYHPFMYGLHKPKSYAITIIEDPSEMDYKIWSPFENKEYFKYQINLSIGNIKFIYKNIHFYLFVFGVLSILFLPIAFLLNPLNHEKRFLYGWVIITFIIYCGGYILTYALYARYYWLILIVALLLSFHFFEELKNNLKVIIPETISHRRKSLLTVYILIVFVTVFTLRPGIAFLRTIKRIAVTEQINVFKQTADQLNALELPGPFAVVGNERIYVNIAVQTAYYMKKQFLGRTRSTDIEGITKELKVANANSLLVFNNLEIAQQLKTDKRYIFKTQLEKRKLMGVDTEIHVFILKQ